MNYFKLTIDLLFIGTIKFGFMAAVIFMAGCNKHSAEHQLYNYKCSEEQFKIVSDQVESCTVSEFYSVCIHRITIQQCDFNPIGGNDE